MSVAIVEGDKVLWRQNLGAADYERGTVVRSETQFPIASLTKTMSATVILQLVREGKLSLDAPLSQFVVNPSLSPEVTVRRVLSHTSEGSPGEEYLYSGSRFALLTAVIEKASGMPLAEVLSARIFVPLAMTRTRIGIPPEVRAGSATDFALPYDFPSDSMSDVQPGTLPSDALSAASGVISTVSDMVRYVGALDGAQLLGEEEKAIAFSPTRSTRGDALPYGLGWFAQEYLGQRIVWHYGQETSYSALLIYLPQKHLAFVALANSSAPSDAARLLDGNVTRSRLATAFLRLALGSDRADHIDWDDIALGLGQRLADLPAGIDRSLARDELIARALALTFVRRSSDAARSAYVAHTLFAPEMYKTADLPMLFLGLRLNNPIGDDIAAKVGARIVAAHPRLPPALYYLALFHKREGRSAEAIRVLEQLSAIPNAPRHWSVVLGLTELGELERSSNPQDARKNFQRVIDMNWNFAGAVDRAKRGLASLTTN